jgi:hypothetical protein
MRVWNDGRAPRSSKINRFGSRNDSQPSRVLSLSFHVKIEGLNDIDGETCIKITTQSTQGRPSVTTDVGESCCIWTDLEGSVLCSNNLSHSLHLSKETEDNSWLVVVLWMIQTVIFEAQWHWLMRNGAPETLFGSMETGVV